MRQITLAFLTWSLDNNDRLPMQVAIASGGTMELRSGAAAYPHFQVMSNELSTPKILLCPTDQRRRYATNFDADLTDSNLSYFVNLDASTNHGGGLLIGDRNVTKKDWTGRRLVPVINAEPIAWTKELHIKKGHLGFCDGTVTSFENGMTAGVIKVGAGTTNWLAVP